MRVRSDILGVVVVVFDKPNAQTYEFVYAFVKIPYDFFAPEICERSVLGDNFAVSR